MSKQHAAGPEKDNQISKEYIGNIWGRKFTILGALLIIFMVTVIYCRHQVTGTQPGFEEQEHSIDKVFEKDTVR